MKHDNSPPKKVWQPLELTLISRGHVHGGTHHTFHEHSHKSGKYYLEPSANGAQFSAGKVAYDRYVHS